MEPPRQLRAASVTLRYLRTKLTTILDSNARLLLAPKEELAPVHDNELTNDLLTQPRN